MELSKEEMYRVVYGRLGDLYKLSLHIGEIAGNRSNGTKLTRGDITKLRELVDRASVQLTRLEDGMNEVEKMR